MIKTIHGNSETELGKIDSSSVDVILTDPPYLYLKNQKLDVPFDEQKIFSEFKRVLKPNGFVVMFGRGESFYRWNVMLADLGFKFKEEIVWDKSYCTSPLMAISRVHETVSIFTKGKGVIRRVKVPYLEMKQHDVPGICQDIKRMSAILRNPKSLEAVKTFLETNCRDESDAWAANDLSISSDITKEDRSVSVMRSLNTGMNEKTIIRSDCAETMRGVEYSAPRSEKHGVSYHKNSFKNSDRSAAVMGGIAMGMNEKTIIKESRDHYNTIHPTQKPVRLLERLLQLVVEPFSGAVVLDTFAGSMSTGEACINLGLDGILIEKDKEYYDSGCQRMSKAITDAGLFANAQSL